MEPYRYKLLSRRRLTILVIIKSTLDVFYLAQIVAGIYRSSPPGRSNSRSGDDFDTFYARHHQLLNQDAWRQYYSPDFLAQATSARFYRLPNLQDLPDSSDPLGQARRQKGIGHFTRLPRWARDVVRTSRRQLTLPIATITQIALSTLEQTILRLRGGGYGSVQPYSETQACFWLKQMWMDLPRSVGKEEAGMFDQFGVSLAQGRFDVWAWEAHYSPERWNSIEARIAPLEPDLDGTRKSEVQWCGLPDGGVGALARRRGWEPEVGSEEEIDFLAAVAVKETEGVGDVSNLDYAMRSHMLLGVLHAAFASASADERERQMEDLKRGMMEAGRLDDDDDDESKAEQWIQEVLMVMEPYVQKWDAAPWPPTAVEDRTELLRHILMENGQLFGRRRISSSLSKEFNFKLKPRE